jgi:hypothetical protein
VCSATRATPAPASTAPRVERGPWPRSDVPRQHRLQTTGGVRAMATAIQRPRGSPWPFDYPPRESIGVAGWRAHKRRNVERRESPGSGGDLSGARTTQTT